jgi:trehalose 6-phosphate synthase
MMAKLAENHLCNAQDSRTAPPALGADSALFLDVDGTLVAIAPTPEAVRVDAGLIRILDSLRRRVPIALVSGRPLADIDALFAPLVLPAAGTHGNQRRRADGSIERHAPVHLVDGLHRPLEEFVVSHPGARLEDKGASLALHWRLAPEIEAEALRCVEDLARRRPALRLLRGKMVAELAPSGHDKGGAIAAFLAEPPFAGRRPVFVGDDVTDEDGFATVERLGGVTALVGDRPSAARWRFAAVEDVHDWLREAAERLAGGVRSASAMPRPAAGTIRARAAPRTAERRLVVVSNRVPVGARASAGGLAVGVLDALSRSGGLWFGWSGELGEPSAPSLSQSDAVRFATLDVPRRDFDAFYNGFSNRVLWPICHFRTGLVEFRREAFEGYLRVNRLFAEHLAPLVSANDRIWVQDYHLMPLGEELRQRGVEAPIGFFLHVPLPPPDLWKIVPAHRELMRALCAYDLVGFQTRSDLDAFRDYLLREADGTDLGDGRLRAFGRTLRADVFPIGIDVDKLAELAAASVAGRYTKRLRDSLVGRSLIIGVDRLDYSKGLVARFDAFGELLEKYPDTRGQVTFMQIAPSSRSDVPEYLEIRRGLERKAGHINGRFAEFDWTPVRYLNKSFNQRQLAGFYRVAKIGLVTPLRDGMNLVAKEYVACQDPDDPGALVLSCFAGAARELGNEAVIVNPFDTLGTAEQIRSALQMPQEERRRRWRAMMTTLRRNDITAWRENFLKALG